MNRIFELIVANNHDIQENIEAPSGVSGLIGGQIEILSCPQCHIRFNKKSHVSRHIRQKHEQIRDFVCNFEGCDKKFKRGSHLKRHLVSHTHEKKFNCLKCIMQFGYKHHLERHIKIVHQKKLFKCQHCGVEFTKKKGLNKHKLACDEDHEEGGTKSKSVKEKKIKKSKRIKKASSSSLSDQLNQKEERIAFSSSYDEDGEKIKRQDIYNQDQDQEQEQEEYQSQDQGKVKMEQNQNIIKEVSNQHQNSQKNQQESQKAQQPQINQTANIPNQAPNNEQPQIPSSSSSPWVEPPRRVNTVNTVNTVSMASIGNIKWTSTMRKMAKRNQEDEQKYGKMLHRCTFSGCLNAYKYHYLLKNHMKRRHQQNMGNQSDSPND